MIELDEYHKQLKAFKDSGHKAEYEKKLESCTNDECSQCSEVDCPHHDPLHFQGTGCPSCGDEDEMTEEEIEEISKRFEDFKKRKN